MAEPRLENDALRVDIELKPTLRLSVTDKRNGFLWKCPGAPFTFHYWQAAQFAVRSSAVAADQGWEFRLIPDEERLEVQCSWPRAACGFRACLALKDTALEVSLPARRLVENRPFDARQMAVDILPGLGAATTGDDGFLLIPRGNGTLCRFDKGEKRTASLLTYAGGDRALTAPVFGIARSGAGLLGITTKGEFNSELVIAANDGPGRDLNYAGPRGCLRFHPADDLEDVDFRFRYCFLDAGDASLMGMARTYRAYLINAQGRPTLRYRASQNPLLQYASAGPIIHVQMAEKRRNSRMTGDGKLVVSTRFAQVPRIAQALLDAGIEAASLLLVGWNCEGRDGLYPARFPVESAVGGADAMAEALREVRQLGFQVGAVDNYTDLYRRSPASREEFTAKQLGGRPWRNGVWAGGPAYVICPQQARERHAQRDMRRLRDLGLEGMLYLDHFPGPGVLRCYDPEHALTRAKYAGELVQLIRMARRTFGLCGVSGPGVFAALEADSCMLPVEEASPVDELDPAWFADEPAPFLPLALHGLTLLTADASADPLRVVEFGATPVFPLSADAPADVISRMNGFCQRYMDELAILADQFIEAYETPGDGLRVVGYPDDRRILINRTDGPAEIDGVTVDARNFQVV
ncbi:MAG: DUF5696 domain-containing protein [Planctomycetota bacterium]